MISKTRRPMEDRPSPLPVLRFEVTEAAQILRMSRAQLYNRIQEGTIKSQKDGARTYFTRDELERYVKRCDSPGPSVKHAPTARTRRGGDSGR